MAKTSGIHWFTPTSMLGALVSGLLLAIGHDQFYNRLNDQPAPIDDYQLGDFAYSKQQANLTVGFTLAFLVKVALVTAASMAYTQVFWATAKTPSHKGGVTLSTIDAMYLAASNLLNFLNPSLWFSAPGPILVALTVWLIPIASIFTPGTLSVGIKEKLPLNVTDYDVPSLDFRNLGFARKLASISGQIDDWGDSFNYAGPSRQVLQVAQAVAMNGAILAITPPAPDSTWATTFDGPSLKCSNVLGEDLDKIFSNVAKWVTASGNCGNAAGYLSWIQRNDGVSVELPYDNFTRSEEGYTTSTNESELRSFDSGFLSPSIWEPWDGAYSSTDGGAHASLYVALLPHLLDVEYLEAMPVTMSCSVPFNGAPVEFISEDASVVRCDMVNATYEVAFDYVDGAQELDVKVSSQDSATTIKILKSIFVSTEPISCLEGNDDYHASYGDTNCTMDQTVLQRISYQSILSAFTSLVQGQATRNEDNSINMNTSVITTPLANLAELRFLDEQYTADEVQPSLQAFLARWNITETRGIGWLDGTDDLANVANRSESLTEALEALFRNITVSLMSSPDLLADERSMTAPPPAKVTFPLSVPTYIYAHNRLWLAYGIAILLSSVSTLAGVIIMILRKKAYSSDFSTILRTTRHAELSTEVAIVDTEGKTPLPDYLAKSDIRFRSLVESNGGEDDDGSAGEPMVESARSSLLESSAPVVKIAADHPAQASAVLTSQQSSIDSISVVEANSGATSMSIPPSLMERNNDESRGRSNQTGVSQ